MDTGAVLGGTGLFISLIGIVYSAINHKNIRSKCCGKVLEVSIDIDSTEQKKPASPFGVSQAKDISSKTIAPVKDETNTFFKTPIAKVIPQFKVDD
jgi:hypothetical protein